MDGDLGLFEALFFVSLTINLCSWLHFGLFALMDVLVAAETQNRITRLRLAHKHNPAFMRNVYVDVVLFTTLPIATLVLTFTTGVLESPFRANYPRELRILFSAVCGIFIFLLFRVCLVAKNSPVKYMNIIIYVVSLATAATVLFSGEDAAIGLILSVSTGDVVLLNCGKFVDVTRVQDVRCRRVVLFLSVYTCIIFRAFLPLACISVSLVNGKPFDMSYPSIFFFFVGILFFGAINTWQVNVAVSRLCRRKRETVIEVPYRQVGGGDAGPKPEDLAIASSSIEMPPSYTEVCGDSSYLPVSLPSTARTSAEGTAGSVLSMGRELLTLDASALCEPVRNVHNNMNSGELMTMETTADTAALL